MRKTLLTLMLLLIIHSFALANTYYVAVNGNDSNAGTIGNPWGTWQKAFNTAVAGDTVYFRGGVWTPASMNDRGAACIVSPKTGYGHNGQPGNRIYYFNYPGETPILDCKNLIAPPPNIYSDGNRYLTGLFLDDAHWMYFKGLTIRNVYQKEEHVRVRGILGWPVSNMIFEQMTIHDIGGEAWYMTAVPNIHGYGFGWDNSGVIPYDTTRFVNCDTYSTCDTLAAAIGGTPGNMGDGVKYIEADESSAVLYFSGCRSWKCNDDAYDLPVSGKVYIENCWAFDNTRNNVSYQNEGNGFKLSTSYNHTVPSKFFHNNLMAWCNLGLFEHELSGLKNFTEISNNTFYRCKIGYQNDMRPPNKSTNSVFKNNIICEPTTKDAGGRPYKLTINVLYLESNNTWDYNEYGSLGNWIDATDVTVTDDDFVLTDSIQAMAQLTAPRKADGSLPDITFLKIKSGSDLIDAGTNAGLPYYGENPDIGYSEYIQGNALNLLRITSYSPNPTAGKVSVYFYSPATTAVSISVTNSKGALLISMNYSAIAGDGNKAGIDLTGFNPDVYIISLNDGTSTIYCKVTKVDKLPDSKTGFIISCYPTMVQDYFEVSIENAGLCDVAIQLYSANGSFLLKEEFVGNQKTIFVKDLAPAVYFVKVNVESQEARTFKIVKN